MCVLIFSTNFVGNITHSKKIERDMIKMYIFLLVKYSLFVSDFHETVFSPQIFENYPNIKFHENPSIGSRVVPCAPMDGRTYMTKLIVAF